jgi:hypothetical protein
VTLKATLMEPTLKAADTLTPLELFAELLELINKSNLPEADHQRALELVHSVKLRLSVSEQTSTDNVDSSQKYHALRGELDGLGKDYDDLDTSNRLHNSPSTPTKPDENS